MSTTIDQFERKRKKQKLITNTNLHQNDIVSLQNSVFEHVELPKELIFSEILTRLPIKSLTTFKSVSKSWNSIISTQNFIKSHLKMTFLNPYIPFNCVFIKSPYYFYILNYSAYDRYPDDHLGEKRLIYAKNYSFYENSDHTFLIGSCNGLVCIGKGDQNSKSGYYFYVYNPVIGKFCFVFDPLGNFGGILMYGFGYVCCKDDYLLFVGGVQERCSEVFVYVFSMKAKIWRIIGVLSEGELLISCGGRGVLVNEILHWDTTQVKVSNLNSVCGFDLVDETFKIVEIPRILLGNGVDLEWKLCEISGCLGVWIVDMNGMVGMWTLKQYGVWDTWMKVFEFDIVLGLCNFCGWTENGKVLVQTDDGSLLLVDPKMIPTQCKVLVKDLGDIEAVNFVQSAVSPFF